MKYNFNVQEDNDLYKELHPEEKENNGCFECVFYIIFVFFCLMFFNLI